MMVRLNGDRVETITREEVEAMCRTLRAAAEAFDSVRDCAEKLSAAMTVFGRQATEAIEAARVIAHARAQQRLARKGER